MLIAIAGGIGVGKSTVIDMLKSMGANTLATDEINREQLSCPHYITQIAKVFPQAVQDNIIDKKRLRSIIFEDDTAREKLNALSHPYILSEIVRRKNQLTGNVYVEIPLIVESGTRNMFDKIWLITAPIDDRVKRITVRDNIDEKSAKSMINSQEGENTAVNFADEIIINTGSRDTLYQKILTLYQNYERQSNTTL